MLPVIRSQSGRRWESRRLLQHLRSPAALPPRTTPPPSRGHPPPSLPPHRPSTPAPHPHAANGPGATWLVSPAGTPNVPRCPESHRDEGCSDAPVSCEPPAVMPRYPTVPTTPHLPAPWLQPKTGARGRMGTGAQGCLGTWGLGAGCSPGWGLSHNAIAGAWGRSYPLLGAAGLTFIFRRELYKLAFLSGLSSRNCVKLNGNELHSSPPVSGTSSASSCAWVAHV